MSDIVTPKCPQCGAELPGGSPGQVCPRCAAAFLKATPTEMPDDATNSSRPFTPPPVAELAPLFPQLEIIELIGQGGMGAVYKARQKELDRIVALKILPPGFGGAAFAERFSREAKALARLNHPGIVTLYEFGRSNGLFFFLMEFVDGATLRQVLHGGRISPREALAIVPAICDALQYAHDQGIVHRDIKPENILLDRRGRTKVADFGLAKLMESGNAVSDSEGSMSANPSTTTHASKVLGTPQYMAPEQFEHPASVDHRADIYALGVVFYQMLTGELPGQPIEPPSKTVRIDVRLDEVVLRALEKNPEKRYQQAGDLKTKVETFAITQQVDGSRQEESQIKKPQPRQDWWTWSPLQSPEVAEICAHLTKTERNLLSILGLLCSAWIAGTVFGIPALLRSYPSPGNWIVASVWGILFVVSIPRIHRIINHFLCSTAWAKDRGFTTESLRQFSFRKQNLWKVLVVLAAGLALIFAQNKAITSYLGLEERPRSNQAGGLVPSAIGKGLVKQVSATRARKGYIPVSIRYVGTVESSNSVMFSIAEEYSQAVIRKFDAHQELTVEADNSHGDRFGHGFLSGVDNRIDTATGTLKCKATLFPEGDNLMVPGLFLNIRLFLGMKPGVTLVPIVAIQHDPQSAFVWVIQVYHTLTRRPVSVGVVDGGWAEIQSGLSSGEIVVSDGFAGLHEGQRVRYDLDPMSKKLAQASSQSDEQASNKDLEWLKIQSLAGWISDLQSPDPNVQKTAERALTDMGTNALPGFLKILSESTDSSNDDDLRRYNTAHALRFMGNGVKGGLPAFTALLQSGDQGKAYAGARALAFSAPLVPEAFSILTNALTDSTPGVREAASHGVGLCLNTESNGFAESALPLLVRNLSDKIDYVRSDTAIALQQYANRQSMRFPPGDAKPELLVPPLIELLHDKYSFARFYASEALWCGCYRDAIKPWIPAVQKLLSDPDDGVRQSATNFLQMLHIGPATNTAQNPSMMQAVTFKAITGTNPNSLSYQWVLDTNNAAGATNASSKRNGP